MASSTQTPTIRIPTRVLDSPSGGDFQWKSGTHRGTLESVERRDLPRSSAGEPFKGYETTDGSELNVRIGSIVYLEDESDAAYAGNRKQFVALVESDGNRTIYDVDNAQSAPYWKLQQSQKNLVLIARALGQVEVDGDDTVIAEGFLDALASGEFNGTEIGFEVKQSKDGKYSNVVNFFSA